MPVNSGKLEKISRVSLRDQILIAIRNAIISGEFKASDKLTEQDLSKQLGVSRTPIREAIRVLELQGLVKVQPKNGTFVSRFDSGEIRDGLHVRLALEELALRQSLDRLSAREWRNHCDQLNILLEQMYQAAEISDNVADIELDIEWHTKMIDAAKNKHLSRNWMLTGASNFIWSLEFRLYPHTTNEIIEHADRHKGLLEVLRRRDLEECLFALKQHILRKIKDTNQ